MIFHNFLQQIHSVFSSKKAELELTGRAEQEYDRIMKELKKHCRTSLDRNVVM